MKTHEKYLLMEGKFEHTLDQLDKDIKKLEEMGKKYPKLSFANMISHLKQKRAEVASSIGKKKK
jgi:predicted translin family RNA/ssDNA-binding protein